MYTPIGSSAPHLDPQLAAAMRDYQRQRQMTLGDLLLENRVIFLQGEIYDGNANEIVMKLLYLQSENRRKDIHFYINSPGGSVSATLAMYDTMQMITPPVATYCVGLAASGGAVLLAGGEKGKRFALKHSKIMIHQPHGGGWGRHGGGAFSGKDPTKVDRSAAYMARYVAKNIVAAGLADRCEVQLAYAIGVAEPVSVHVDTQGTGRVDDETICKLIRKFFPLTPKGIIAHLDLRRPIYQKTAAGGHFGRDEASFSWEKTDMAEKLAEAAGVAAGAAR